MTPGQPATRPGFLGHSLPPSATKTRATAEGGCKKCPSYKRLPKEFRHCGFSYRQIGRERNVAIYEQCSCGHAESSVCYEIVRIRRREGFEIHGRFVEPAEIYPSSEAWGRDGITVTDKEAAFAKLRELA
jgi:hypothetical protein